MYQPSINFLQLMVPSYSLEKILKVKVTTARSKVKLRSHNDIAYLQPLTNVHTKYQHSIPYRFSDIVQTRF